MEAEDDLDDPERLIQCPYDKQHQIRACRFPYHLVKCRKSHPEVAKLLATCPFNARHLVPRADLVDHISKCRDKGFIEHDIAHCSSGFQRDEVNAVSTWQAPPCDEDWETELLEQPNSPFVWGMTNSGINRKHRVRVIAASSHKLSLHRVGAWCFNLYSNGESSVNSLQHAIIACNPYNMQLCSPYDIHVHS